MYNGAIEVWDYSSKNIQKMNLTTIHKMVPYLPQDYSDIVEKMSRFKKDKTIPYLFYGCMNRKRKQILNKMNKDILCYGYLFENGPIFGDILFTTLGQSKNVINIHYYDSDPPILEVYRITECLLLGVTVISEDGFMDSCYRDKLPNLIISDDIVKYINFQKSTII